MRGNLIIKSNIEMISMIEILYFAELKEITGKASERLPIKDVYVNIILEKIFEFHPKLRNILWDEQSKTLKKSISIAIDDRIRSNHQIEQLLIKDGTKIAFLLPMSGG